MKVWINWIPGRFCQILLLACVLLAGCSQSSKPPDRQTNEQYAPVATSAVERTSAQQAILPPQSLPADYEELWVIQRPGPQINRDANTELVPGSGLLLARIGPNMLVCPLQRTDFDARITGAIATVNVTQNFRNPSNQVADLIYAFSLPQGAAVSDFVMTIGQRHIRGIIRERAEAEQIYRQARDQGYSASLLSQIGPNLFAQSLANVAPTKSVEVAIQYFHAVPYVEGWFTLSFPLMTGPRQRSWPQPALRNGRDVTVNVQLDCGFAIDRIESPTHGIKVDRSDSSHAIIALDAGDTIANQDMEIRYKPAAGGIRSSMVTQSEGGGGYCALTVLPPEEWRDLPRRPVELLILSSVSDPSAVTDARMLAAAILGSLAPTDSFAIVDLHSDVHRPLQPATASPPNIQNAINTLDFSGKARVSGQTSDQLKLAASKSDPSHARLICIFCDGADDIAKLSSIVASAPRGSLVVCGTGTHVDSGAINALAAAGGGAAIHAAPSDAARLLLDAIDRFARPCVTDLQIDWNGTTLKNPLFASSERDLIAGRPLLITARFVGPPPKVTLRGNSSTGPVSISVNPTLEMPAQPGILARMYARLQLAHLVVHQADGQIAGIDQTIKRICLENGLISRFTSFVCVDARGKVVDPTPAPQTMHGGSI
ncbi:MAG TPA: VIT domain-containing protein [Humisphaera sp.]|jgi:Ca-activated chloride channel family protein|nr:VIT domain-containing protein [Humisphaera sp.]